MLADLEPVFDEHPGWRRIYLDLPGHGSTPAPEWLSTEDQLLSIVRDFIDAVVPDGTPAIAGSSYGGRLAVGLVRLRSPTGSPAPGCWSPRSPRRTDPWTRRIIGRSSRTPRSSRISRPTRRGCADTLVVHERWMVDEIRAHDMPAYRRADYEFLSRLEANMQATGAAGRPGPPFDGPVAHPDRPSGLDGRLPRGVVAAGRVPAGHLCGSGHGGAPARAHRTSGALPGARRRLARPHVAPGPSTMRPSAQAGGSAERRGHHQLCRHRRRRHGRASTPTCR